MLRLLRLRRARKHSPPVAKSRKASRLRLPARIPAPVAPFPFSRGEVLRTEDRVETLVGLPGIPAGSIGRIKEIGRPFLAVEFADGHVGYYSLRQLRKRPADGLPKPERT